MTVKLARDGAALSIAGTWLTGHLAPINLTNPSAPQLPIGMILGLVSFGPATSASGVSGTTINNQKPSLTATATPTATDPDGLRITLAASIVADIPNDGLLSASYVGEWAYKFNVSLDF